LAVVSFFCQRFGKQKGCLTKRAADRASPWWYGAGLLAMVMVCGGVLPVRPAANANRWAA
jgi:hypothetical protein